MKKYIILIFILFCGTFVYAGDYNVYKTKSGQTIIVKQVKSNPIVIIDTWIKTGSINETDKDSGVSHFLEHLFFKGTLKHPTGEFDKVLEAKGAVTNAATSKDFTHYYIKLPSKYFDLALDYHADMLLNPQIPSKEMEKERKVVLEEIAKDQNSPNEIVYNNLNELMYKVHPYKRKVIGSAKIIETVTREEILDYYKKHYAPENMVTIVVGDVNPDEAAKKVEDAFKTNAPRKIQHNKFMPELPITTQRMKEVTTDSNSAYMMIGFRGVKAKNKDEYALDVLSTVLGDGRSSRFYKKIKDAKQLATSISASNLNLKDDGLFIINTEFAPENKELLLKTIFEEIENVKCAGITDEELITAKNIIERDTYYSRESISNIASEMGYTVVLTDNPKDYDNYLEGIKNVTLSDVKRVANKYFAKHKSAVSILLPKNNPCKCTSDTEKPVSNVSAKLVKTAYNTDKYQLPTGATLLINKHNNNDIIAISIKAKGGRFIETKHGSADLTASVMLKGTKNYTSQELAQILEEKGINIASSAGSDYFSLNVLTTKQQLPLTLEILDEVVNNAKYDEYEIDKTRKNMIANIRSNRDIPLNRALEEYKNAIYENSVYSIGSKKLETYLPKVTRADILDYYSRIFYPQNLIVSINGDVDKQQMINVFTKIFNSKKGKVFSYTNHLNEVAYRTTQKTIVTPINNLQTGWIIIGWQVAGNAYIKDFAALQLIDTFMGTGMSSRLFRTIREQSGLAYQVGSGYSPNALKGTYTLYLGTNPKNVSNGEKQMLNEIKILKSEFVSDKELQNAKDQLIGKFVLALETNLDKASALSLYEATGRGFAFVEEYPKIIQNITASDIMEVANKYFMNNYVESIVDRAK